MFVPSRKGILLDRAYNTLVTFDVHAGQRRNLSAPNCVFPYSVTFAGLLSHIAKMLIQNNVSKQFFEIFRIELIKPEKTVSLLAQLASPQ